MLSPVEQSQWSVSVCMCERGERLSIFVAEDKREKVCEHDSGSFFRPGNMAA